MGLDVVELVMDVEETFQIQVPDVDAAQIHTVGDLYHFILLRLPGEGRGPRRCATAVAFYRLRRALVADLGVDRRSVRPGSDLDDLLPRRSRRSTWAKLADDTHWRLPQLQRPSWLVRAMVLVLVAFQVGLAVKTRAGVDTLALRWLLTTPLLVFLGYQATRPFAVRLPACCMTVGDTIRTVVHRNYGAIGPEVGYRPEDVWTTLRRIIAEQLAVPPGRITEEARIVEDLGAE
jgi:acyl carrier protein